MKFEVTELIRKKRRGENLSEAELQFLLTGYLQGQIQDYHLSAFMMAVCFQGMSKSEMHSWATLMWRSGITFPRQPRRDFWIDKHSSGGVGDKTSLILVPLVHVAAEKTLGSGAVKIPMISGRGLDFTGGTLDKLDSIPGFRSDISVEKALSLLQKNGFFMAGQTADLAPADRLLYALRDVTATVDCIPLAVSSIMSKKLAENLDGLVFDVKHGRGALMPDAVQARELALALTGVATAQGVRATAVLTSMQEPLGWKVGNQLEVEECADFLSGKPRERGLEEVTLKLAAEMLVLASGGKLNADQALLACHDQLENQAAYPTFVRMFEAQGGDWNAFCARRVILESRPKFSVGAPSSGFLARVDALAVAKLVRSLGGGRQHKEASINPDVGVILHKKVGDAVQKNDTVFDVVFSDARAAQEFQLRVEDFLEVSPSPSLPTEWITEVIHA